MAMQRLTTPGISICEVDITPPGLLRMSVTALVGQAERGPLNDPQPLTNWGQFSDIFGDFLGWSYLAYAVFGFFLNGGDRCYVVRVAHETARCATLSLPGQLEGSATAAPVALQVYAINPGAWGNDLAVTVTDQSAGDLALTELAADVSTGQASARLKSVAGLVAGDTVTLVHQRDPLRERLEITGIDRASGGVTFERPVASPAGFPQGSGVFGKGFKLTVSYQPEGVPLREEVFDNLSLNPDHPRYVASVINGEPEAHDYLARMKQGNSILIRVVDLARRNAVAAPRPQAITAQTLSDGNDGPSDFGAAAHQYYTGYTTSGTYFRPVPPGADDATHRQAAEARFGLAACEPVSDIGLIAIPDLVVPLLYRVVPPAQIPADGIIFADVPASAISSAALQDLKYGQRAMLSHCERVGERFALLDAPPGLELSQGANTIADWPGSFQLSPGAKYGALYYPWIKEKAADVGGRELFIPPSGHLAGIYARSERERGIGKAPANELIHGITELAAHLNDADQALLNPRGVNCLRVFPGRGLRVWGARTLSADPLWLYINVRRVVLAIIKSILARLQWTVFEPNDRQLWDRIVGSLTLFLRDLFQSGALAGARQEDAFFVQCDDETNSAATIDRGEVYVRVGFAPARPAEFVVVTIMRTAETVSVKEQGAG